MNFNSLSFCIPPESWMSEKGGEKCELHIHKVHQDQAKSTSTRVRKIHWDEETLSETLWVDRVGTAAQRPLPTLRGVWSSVHQCSGAAQ